MRRNSVDDAEIDHLGAPARLGRHRFERHAEHIACGRSVNIEPAFKRMFQRFDIGHVCEQAQYELRIVSANQLMPRLDDEGGADLQAAQVSMSMRKGVVRKGVEAVM